jgi:hypothetical protein
MLLSFFPQGATAPSGPGPPQCWGFKVTFRHTTLGRTLDELSTRRRDLYLTTHNTHIHALAWIRTRNPRTRAAADPCLRQRGHWDRLITSYILHNYYFNKVFYFNKICHHSTFMILNSVSLPSHKFCVAMLLWRFGRDTCSALYYTKYATSIGAYSPYLQPQIPNIKNKLI